MQEIFFEEEQKFRQWWLWALIIFAGVYSIWPAIDKMPASADTIPNDVIIVSIIVINHDRHAKAG